MAFFEKKAAINILFNPEKYATNDNNVAVSMKTLQSPLLGLIQKMVLIDPILRPSFNETKEQLAKLVSSDFSNKQSLLNLHLKFNRDIIKGHCGNTAELCDTAYLLLPTYKYSMSSRAMLDGVSAEIHDQDKSFLCWGFALATVMASEMARFIGTSLSASPLKVRLNIFKLT